MRCECLQYINKNNFHFYQNKNQTKINLKYKLSSKETYMYSPQYKCYNTVANGVLVNKKIKVKPTDENILHVLSLISTVILKDNIIHFPVLYLRHYHYQDCCPMPESSGIRSASSMGIKSLSAQCTSNLPLLITHPLS